VHDLAECEALRVALGTPGARRPRPIVAVDVPTAMVWSERDRVLGRSWARGGFAHLDAQFSELPAVGHVPMLDDPRAVAALISRHVAQRRSA
jgi:pimeloyl-ACP methyl ester carboxylesterase